MKRKMGITLAMAMVVLATGCGADKKVSEETTVEKMTTKADKSNIVDVEELKIENGENTVYGKLYLPSDEGEHPAIILSHGYNGTGNDFAGECKYFAQNGYVAYAFDFCGGSGSSRSTGKSVDMTITREKSDLLAVLDYIRTMDGVDEDQIYLFGGSQGGLVTALAAEERVGNIRGLILYFPAFCVPDDWRKTYPDVNDIPETVDFWGLTLGKQFFVDIHDLNVFGTIGSYDKDVLILHGDKDAIVPLDYSVQAQQIYKKAELITMTGEGHGFTPAGAKMAQQKALEFMNEHLN